MKDLAISDLLRMQKALQAAHAHEWTPLTPEKGRGSLLWMVEEVGEVASVIKKKGDSAIMKDEAVRAHFVEELCDVLMYYGDVLLCYDITAEELSQAFQKKHDRNLCRDYSAQYEAQNYAHSEG